MASTCCWAGSVPTRRSPGTSAYEMATAARRGLACKFERDVDPEGVLDPRRASPESGDSL